MDDKFVQTVWNREHENQSADDLHKLLSQHFDDVDRLRKKRYH